jgi:hypothetical protein
MRRLFLTSCFFLTFMTALGQTRDMWHVFSKTQFEPKFDESLGEYIFYPKFPQEVLQLEGKEVTLTGYYVPFAPEGDDYIIVSKYPMSQCFFCGGGGPESVAEVNFAGRPERFRVDDLITVRGKLRLNVDDPDHINFILIDAVLLKD